MIPAGMLTSMLSCSVAKTMAAAAELVAAGLWQQTDDGWLIVEWEATQSTVEQIENNRKNLRERVAKHRQKSAGNEAL